MRVVNFCQLTAVQAIIAAIVWLLSGWCAKTLLPQLHCHAMPQPQPLSGPLAATFLGFSRSVFVLSCEVLNQLESSNSPPIHPVSHERQ